jgi:hypothetical protein
MMGLPFLFVPINTVAEPKTERPGLRRANYYAAFVLDPDGNNIEAVFRGALAD